MANLDAQGRPTKLTPEVQDVIVETIKDGNYYQPACAKAGIHYQTFLNWMKWGEEQGEGIYFDFFEKVQWAEAEAEAKMVADWKAQVPQDWRAARDFLARRHPERWAPKTYLDAQLSGELGVKHGLEPIDDPEIAKKAVEFLELVADRRGKDLPGGSGDLELEGPVEE